MSVYKEAMHIVSTLQGRQSRIFLDAADYGIPIKSEDDPAFNLIRQLVEQYWNNDTDRRTVKEFSLGTTIELQMQMIDEFATKAHFHIVITYTRQEMKRTLHGPLIGILEVDGGLWDSSPLHFLR